MGSDVDVIVIGAGGAGLSVSRHLVDGGVEHLVLERDEVGGSWARRWDSFCLVTPNHTIRLPGAAYAGPEPHGFLGGRGVTAFLQDYAAGFDPPVRTGVEVRSLQPSDGQLLLDTGDEHMTARAVVVATGAYQRAHRPASLASLPRSVQTLVSDDYRNPHTLPEGTVLVVGSGQSGCQIAEELCTAGRDVVLACGRSPWIPRRIGGRDTVDWLLETPFFDLPVDALPDPGARLWANPQATGVAGGHDLTYRTLQRLGVRLAGRVRGADESGVHFADDLAASVAFGDARYADVRRLIATVCAHHGRPAPEMPSPAAFTAARLDRVPVEQLGAVVVACGYRPAYRSWIEPSDAFDAEGFPRQHDGASTIVSGLYFAGVHFMRSRKSSLLLGVGGDAAVVARDVAEQVSSRSHGS